MNAQKHTSDLPLRRALLMAQFFPPLNVIASQRAMRLAKVLLKHFDEVIVLTQPTTDIAEKFIDREFGAPILAHPRIRVIAVSPWLDGYGSYGKNKLAHQIMGALITRVLCSTGLDWGVRLKSVLGATYRASPFDLLLSTGGPFPPFLPAVNFSRQHGVFSILDYRDLWAEHPHGAFPLPSKLFVRHTLERYVNTHCNLITTVSEGCRRVLAQDLPESKVKTLPNLPDQDYTQWLRHLVGATPAMPSFAADDLNLVYAGTVYKRSTGSLLVSALKALPDQLRPRVKLHYCGLTPELLKADFDAAGLHANFVDHGYLKKERAVAILGQADALLSLVLNDNKKTDSHAHTGIMTTKIFDYFLTGKPIVNVGPSDSDLVSFAQNLKYTDFINFEPDNDLELAAFLTNNLNDLQAFRKRRSHAELPEFDTEFSGILEEQGFAPRYANWRCEHPREPTP